MVDLPAGRQGARLNMYYVYVLYSLKTKTSYVGLTSDIDRRLRDHEHGKNISTKNKRPFKLVHVEIVGSREGARKLEKYFKSGYGREIIREIFNN